jgi:hypothetical protein
VENALLKNIAISAIPNLHLAIVDAENGAEK